MMRHLLMICLAFGLLSAPVRADDMIGSYRAYIGRADLFNSNGKRLTEVWQVLRQDRANFHRFHIAQPGDQWDAYFATADNRAALERMIRQGAIERGAARAILAGGVLVEVRIYGRAGVGRYVEVSVVG